MKVTTKQWTSALESACEGKTGTQLETTVGEFVRLLARRGELGRVREVIRRLTTVVVAETAHPLKPAMRKAIEAAAAAPVTEIVNPDLIGGMRLRINDRVLDGSIAGQLERLKRTLAE
jgi:F0F1-type ATP synthase delta subunit